MSILWGILSPRLVTVTVNYIHKTDSANLSRSDTKKIPCVLVKFPIGHFLFSCGVGTLCRQVDYMVTVHLSFDRCQ